MKSFATIVNYCFNVLHPNCFGNFDYACCSYVLKKTFFAVTLPATCCFKWRHENLVSLREKVGRGLELGENYDREKLTSTSYENLPVKMQYTYQI